MKTSSTPEINSASNGHEECSVLSISEQPSVNRFLGLLENGVLAWEHAGKILVQLKHDDPLIFDKLILKCDWLTLDILWSFHRMGEGRLYPRVLLMGNRPGERRLLSLPVDLQKQLCHQTISVVTAISKGEPVIEKKSVRDLTIAEVDRVFVGNRLRSVSEQKVYVAPRPPAQKSQSTTKPCPFCFSSDVKMDSKDEIQEFRMICEHCQAHGPLAGNIEDATSYWNDRKYERRNAILPENPCKAEGTKQ